MGGDLRLIARLVRDRDRDGLIDYATACIDLVHDNAVGLGLPIVTVSLVQGDALGGGFEAAVSSNFVIAEKRAKFGLPEILFNLFPGMGGYSLIARRIGAAQAERMMLSGRIYGAEQLYELGLVDVLAEDGEGEQAVMDFIARHSRSHGALHSVVQARWRVNPLTYEELHDIAMMWVDTAMALGKPDLNRMERLATAQDRRREAAQARS
jgi:DSF synthase